MSNQNISTKLCVYGCGQNLYFNTSVNEYWEVFTKKKHYCPNRQQQSQSKPTISTTTTAATTRPNYYNRFTKQPKPKMSNSFELLQGSIAEIQKQYENLSDIVLAVSGRVHGSQRDRDPKTGLIDLLVYYEVPEGKRDEVKQKFESLSKSEVKIFTKRY